MKRLFFLSPLVFVLIFLWEYKPSRSVIQQREFQQNYVHATAAGTDYIWHHGDWIRNGNTYVYHKGFWIKPPVNHAFSVAGSGLPWRTGWKCIRPCG